MAYSEIVCAGSDRFTRRHNLLRHRRKSIAEIPQRSRLRWRVGSDLSISEATVLEEQWASSAYFMGANAILLYI